MAKFSEAIHEDLEKMRKKMADNARAADSYLQTVFSNANGWTAKLKQAFQSVSKDVEDIDSAMVSIAKKSKDADHVVNQFVKNIYESTAEVSAGQGKALAVGTTQIQHQVDTVTNSLRETQERLANMAVVVNSLVPMVVSMSERLNASDTRIKATLAALANVSDAVSSHTQQLNMLHSTAFNLNEHLEQATATAQVLSKSLSQGNSIPDWTIRTGMPLGTITLGNVFLECSFLKNVQLGLTGLVIGQFVVWARTPLIQSICQSGLTFINFISSTREPSSVTQKARAEKAASIVATPAQFDLPSAADSNELRPEMI